jgi:hypothetical protein
MVGKKLTVVLKGSGGELIFDDVRIENWKYRLEVWSVKTNERVAEFDKDTILRWHLDSSD